MRIELGLGRCGHANLCAIAIGTETDGSIICPSGNNLVVGLKPTIGVLGQDGIVPIAKSQDTAGPIGRTVTDVAILQGAMQGNPALFGDSLKRGALDGARIGKDERYFTPDYGGEPDLVAAAEAALAAMASLGATIVPVDTGDPFVTGDAVFPTLFDAEFLVLLAEFKVGIAKYLAGLGKTRMRSLADLIAFNDANCAAEMRYYGQEIFEIADSLTDADLALYPDARALCIELTRAQGIDRVLNDAGVDAIVAPIYCFASSPAAIAGYPSLSLPTGMSTAGRPAGLWMYGGAHDEATLLALAYDLEQALKPRDGNAPSFSGTPQPFPDDPGICAGLPRQPRGFLQAPHRRSHLGTGKRLPG